MKLAIASDIHLEFGACQINNTEDAADVLILAGDICLAHHANQETEQGDRVRDFFWRVSLQYPQVLYVLGNHEHYKGDVAKSQLLLQGMLDQLGIINVHILEKATFELDDVLFIGGTLWTDFNNGDPLAMFHAKTAMNDYHAIRNTASGNSGGTYKFIPEHTFRDHGRMVQYIRHVIANRREQGKTDARVIMIGHHAPSLQSIAEEYQGQDLMNANFASDLSELILDSPEIALWIHGHTHNNFDYQVGSTRIVCNPRGYVGYESRTHKWKPQIIDF